MLNLYSTAAVVSGVLVQLDYETTQLFVFMQQKLSLN